MELHLEVRLAQDASRRHGILTRAEVLGRGLSERTLHRRIADGRLIVVAPEVYRCAGAPTTWHQRMLVACLTEGDPALASHRSAAALHGFDGFRPGIVEVTTPRWLRRHRPGVRVHESTDLAAVDRSERGSVPVTGVERTLIDLGAVVHRHKVEQALDDALRRGLTTPEQLRNRFLQLARKGRRGVGVLRPLLDGVLGLPGIRPGEFERRVCRLLVRARFPAPVCEHEVRTPEGVLIARVDLAYVLERLAIECDSERWHSSRQQRQADLERQNRLVLAGYTVLRFTWDDLVHHPESIIRQVADALAAAA